MSILESFKERMSSRLVPMQVSYEMTYRCNERCGHCYLTTYDDRADGRPPLRLEEWLRITDELADAGALLLVLMGGEAMLHPHFWDIASHGASRGFAVNLITNGLLIDDAAAARMAALPLNNVTVSLYSLHPTIHDGMTARKGSWERTIAALRRLKASGVRAGINCLLTSKNIDGCFELEDWAAGEGFQVGLDPLVTAKSDGSLSPTATRPTPDQLRHYYEGMARRGRVPQPAAPAQGDAPVCNAGRGKCAVNAYGDLLTCLEVRTPVGNLREKSFKDLWHSPAADALRGRRNQQLKFNASCGNGAFCDHCPGMAEAETGDPFAPVPYLMEIAAIKAQVFSEWQR